MTALKKEIEVQIVDDEGVEHTYRLRYNLNALRRFEELYHNKSIMEMFAPSLDTNGNMILDPDGNPVNLQFSVGMMADLIWVGTRKYSSEVTQEQLGDWLDMDDVNTLMPKVSEALAISNKRQFPQEKIEDKGKKRPKK